MALNYFVHDLQLLQRWNDGMDLVSLEEPAPYLTLSEIAQMYIATSRRLEDAGPNYSQQIFDRDIYVLSEEEILLQKRDIEERIIKKKEKEKKKKGLLFPWANSTLYTGRQRVRGSKDRIEAKISQKAKQQIIDLHPFPAETIGSRVILIGKQLYRARKTLEKHFYTENLYSKRVGECLLVRPRLSSNRLPSPPKNIRERYEYRLELIASIQNKLLKLPNILSRKDVIRYMQNRKPANALQYAYELRDTIPHPDKPLIRNYLKSEKPPKKEAGSPYAQIELFNITLDEMFSRMKTPKEYEITT